MHKIERVQYNLKIVNTELSNFHVIDYSVCVTTQLPLRF